MKPPSLWFKKSIHKPQSEYSQDYAQKPQRNCTFMNAASVLVCTATVQYTVIIQYSKFFAEE